MDKIRIDFFDILGYIIPGAAMLILCWVAADSSVHSLWQIYDSVHKADRKAIFMALFLSYIIGFALHIVGRYLYNLYIAKIKINYTSPLALSTSDKWTYIREYGEKHLSILERWYALKAFAHNLAAICFIAVGVCIYKWFQFGYFEWFMIALFNGVGAYFFLQQSKIFHEVLHKDLDSIILLLGLEQRGKSLSKQKE